MALTVLSDSDIKDLLQNLSVGEVETLQKSMRRALHEYSTGTQDEIGCSNNQPKRTSIESKNGTTTLFMPSTSSYGIGMKVITLATPGSVTSSTATTSPIEAPTQSLTPQGALTLMANTGKPFGFLNAEEITAFRTALASSLLISRRAKIKTLTVFGTGKQAYWHLRLALLLRGSTIKNVNIINRTFNERARNLLKSFLRVDATTKEREGWASAKFGILTPAYGEFDRMVKEQIRAADVLFCTTPSTEPLFDEKILTNTEGRKKGRLIIAIGSYKPHMIELPPEILTQAVKLHGPGPHFHKHAEEGGVVVVDTLTSLREVGELIEAGIHPHQLVEIGELVMLSELDAIPDSSSAVDDSPQDSLESLNLHDGSRSIAHVFRENSLESGGRRSSSQPASRKSSFSLSRESSLKKRSSSPLHGGRGKKQSAKDDAMSRWLSSGTVIYKSVGLGLMDLVVGADLVMLAREKSIGTTINGFC